MSSRPEGSAAFDRRVHARSAQGREIVRYHRRGHWYEEWPDGFRERIDIKEAVMRAIVFAHDGGELYVNVPGGGRFDYLLRQA